MKFIAFYKFSVTEKREAYDLFHGTSLSNIGKTTEPKEVTGADEDTTQKEDKLSELEAEFLITNGSASGFFAEHMKRLGLTLEDVKAGKRK